MPFRGGFALLSLARALRCRAGVAPAGRTPFPTSYRISGAIIDPVASGLVTNLARPGGNITGLSMMTPELVGKQLEILKEVVPKVSRVALLSNPANLGNAPQVRHAQDAVRALGVRLQPLEASAPSEIDSAFAAMTNEQAGAVIVLVDAMLLDHRTQLQTSRHGAACRRCTG